VYGQPASKANSRIRTRWGGVIKSERARAYMEEFESQVRPIDPLFEGDVRVTMEIYYASRRPDLDESLILDLLQGKVYLNDRQVKEKHIFWGLDKEQPRSVIMVEAIKKMAPGKGPKLKENQTLL
jgi:Holliday junction resolvase RusA-like endonuclease